MRSVSHAPLAARQILARLSKVVSEYDEGRHPWQVTPLVDSPSRAYRTRSP
ncbi:hypothetical protein [Austwickia chelonae]|uniref:hypothetical protein n=1 Tax=Austwickia chelonae TaxID=100225 RepID=UPI0012DDBF2C|nr:hypothetical protein [Austwickia chelonae]